MHLATPGGVQIDSPAVVSDHEDEVVQAPAGVGRGMDLHAGKHRSHLSQYITNFVSGDAANILVLVEDN